MSRFWLGAGILLGLLLLGLLSMQAMDASHQNLSSALEQAGEEALAGNWEEADRLAETARQRWQRQRGWIAVCASHEPMEQIDTLLAQLEICRALADPVGYALNCAALGSCLAALGQTHAVNWWSLL